MRKNKTVVVMYKVKYGVIDIEKLECVFSYVCVCTKTCCVKCVDMQGGVRRAVCDNMTAELYYITKEEKQRTSISVSLK